MNATVTVQLSSSFGVIDDENRPQGPFKDVLTDNVDIVLNVCFLRDFWKMQSYPFYSTSFKIISLKNPMDSIDRVIFVFP